VPNLVQAEHWYVVLVMEADSNFARGNRIEAEKTVPQFVHLMKR
jgi:hypothetical protein